MVKMRLWEHPQGAFAGLKKSDIIQTTTPIHVIRVPKGMQSGRSAIILRVDLPDGQIIAAKTTAKLFLQVADALRELEETRH
jgi:hypothetical protein